MKNTSLFLIIILSSVFYSCEKENVTVKPSLEERIETYLRGFMKDLFTNAPIVGTTVYLYDGVEGSIPIMSVVTNENGEFEFKIPSGNDYNNDLYLKFSNDLLSDYTESSTINGAAKADLFLEGLRLAKTQSYSFEIELTPKQ